MTDFKIISLDWQSFSEACKKLRSAVDNSGFKPDTVIAIPRGGSYLLQYGWNDAATTKINIHKPSGFSLKKHAAKLIKLMPLALRDRLRIWDAKRLIRRSDHMTNTTIEIPALDDSVKKILLVDDAVDSGATLLAVISKLKEMRTDIDVRCAAITVTSDRPLCMPDYFLYHNSTLIRMPWSIDAE